MTLAKYIRLSSEDGDLNQGEKVESNSITNQRNLLDAYISRTPEFADAEVVEFCDDGWSGKNFERPGVQELLTQTRQGKIQCILVKDMSRFGRDYLIVGNYISRVFPFLGVRFIAVNDGFDSCRPGDIDSLETSFKTLLYDLYSRDLSRKVRSAQKFRAKRGDYLSPFAPYGYIKDPKDRRRLAIDPPAAETVRRIFQMIEEGQTAEEIARTFNRENVLTPMLYKRMAGCSRTNWPSVNETNFWTRQTVLTILQDRRYLGVTVFGKRSRNHIGDASTVRNDPKDWIVAEETHEAIISQAQFDLVQGKLHYFQKTNQRRKKSSLLQGKVRCGICGHAMSCSEGKSTFFCCKTSRVMDAYSCTDERISEADMIEAVLRNLHIQAMIAVKMSRLLEERCQKKTQALSAIRKELAVLNTAQAKQEQQARGLYESFFAGEISKAAYLAVKSSRSRQQEETASRIAELEALLENTDAEGGLQNQFADSFQKYTDVREITQEIADDVLEGILIYPGGRFEITWKYRDEYAKLMFELKEEAVDPPWESMDLLSERTS